MHACCDRTIAEEIYDRMCICLTVLNIRKIVDSLCKPVSVEPGVKRDIVSFVNSVQSLGNT